MEIKDKNKGIFGVVTLTFENVITGEKTIIKENNLIVTLALNSLASRLAGADAGAITYCSLGTSTTAPDVADTTLGTEIFRKPVSSRSAVNNVANFRTFFTTEEANGTLKEVGLFGGNASDTADSGTLFAHRAINKTKTSSETLTVDWDITVT